MEAFMSKYTPGPWTYRVQGDANDYALIMGEPPEQRWLYAIRQNGELWTEEQIANMHLITAAPVLADALKAVEWGAEIDAQEGGFIPGCPSCGAARRMGKHYDHCELRAALDAAGVTDE
jgi:hypothetical protein